MFKTVDYGAIQEQLVNEKRKIFSNEQRYSCCYRLRFDL